MESISNQLKVNQALESSNKVTLTCECGKQYETYTVMLQMIRKYSQGDTKMRCYECRAKLRKENEEAESQAIQKEISKRKAIWVQTCGIMPHYQDKTFQNYKVTKLNKLAYDTSLEYAELFPIVRRSYHSLCLTSDKIWGVGKTHLACAITRRLIDRWVGENCPVYFITEPKMFNRIKATYNHQDGHETEQAVFDNLINIPLLVVDDVGKEDVADPRFVQRVWFQIINGRYDNMLPIVLTANMSPDEVANHLGGSRNNEASFDRLYEMLNGVFYEIGGDSHRRGNE